MVTDESTALEVYKRVIDNKSLDGLDVSFRRQLTNIYDKIDLFNKSYF